MLLLSLFPVVALAHERRTVGPLIFVVGFLTEPAIQNQPNGLSLNITDASGNPVEGVEKTLKVAIAYGGGAPKELPLRARFGLKGQYTADVIPTKSGAYSFTFTGSVNGQTINERFESGPGRFNDVTASQSLEFPETVPPPADLAQQTQEASAQTQAALQRATLLGLGGIGVGLVGVVLAIVALVMRAGLRSTLQD